MLVLGVDSGGAKTICAMVDEKLEVLGAGMAGPSNYHVVGVEQAKKNVGLAIKRACSVAGLRRKRFDIGCFGMGGLNTERDREIISNFVKSLGVSKEYEIVNDVVVAYYAVTLGKPGVGVVAGAGSIAYGADSRGTNATVSGWGWLIGDEGSAFYIARKALMHATKAVDGRASSTKLVELAKKHFGISRFDDIITAVYHDLARPKNIASFAELVSGAAQDGDEAAEKILTDAGKELALSAETAARKVGITDQPIIIGGVGGVWQSSIVWGVFKDELKKKLPRVTFREPIEFPVVGALVMGLSKKGIKISEKDADELENGIRLKLKSKK
jgi:N-acetylglucosamine kinase